MRNTFSLKTQLVTSVTLALALAFPSANVIAQQANSSITIYGRVDTSYIYQSNRGAAGPQNVIGSGAFQPSQFGIKGSEDLGDGLKALFGLETTILSDTGALASSSRLFDRTAIVGLSSTRWGTLTIGRQVTPLAELFYATDPLKAGNGATNMNVRFGYLGGAGPKVAGNFGSDAAFASNSLDRQDNSVKYALRGDSGLLASAMLAFGESVGSTAASNAAGALLGYDHGPLQLRGSAMQFHDTNGVAFDAFALGAGFQISSTLMLKLTLTKNKILSGIAAYGNQTTRVYSSGLTWTAMPNLGITVAYYYGERSSDGKDSQVARKLYFIPEYKLSKRTAVYALLDVEHFNAAGSQLDTGTPLAAGTSHSNYLAMGIGHNF